MSSEIRKSQNILKGLVQNKGYSRPESVPIKDPTRKSTRNKENCQYSKLKNNFTLSLNQIGLPNDTFEGLVLLSDRKQFQKSVENLKKCFPICYENTEIDLKDLKRNMLRDLRSFEMMQSYHTIDTPSMYDDDEVININQNSSNMDMSKKFRSSSALSSKIPTPIKPQKLPDRCKSKMELRIQRRISVDAQKPPSLEISNQMNNSYHRRYSVQKDVVNFEEFF